MAMQSGAGGRVRHAVLTAIGVYLLFTAVGLLEGTQGWVGVRTGHLPITGYTYRGQTVGWFDVVARQTLSWWVFATYVLATIAFGRRFPIRRRTWLRAVSLHLAVSLIFPVLSLGSAVGLRYAVFLRHEVDVTYGALLGRALAIYYVLYFLYYWAIIGVTSAFLFYRMYRDRAVAEARLERDLSDAQLSALHAQLQPHFLFNTLNAVCGYALERDHDAVIAMLTRLSDLLRAVLRRRSARMIPLEEELRTLNAYVELQRFRLGDRLTTGIDVHADVLDAAVPPLLLQPIVENAIQHGASRVVNGGFVEVTARRRNGTVDIAVADNGPGFDDTSRRDGAAGFGLQATAERLRLAYGDACAVEACARAGGGTVLRLTFPYLASGDAAGTEAA